MRPTTRTIWRALAPIRWRSARPTFPTQQNDYYQVTWEPQWADSTANFVAMYAAVYNGLHSTDPNAVVMGTTNVFPANCVTACTQGYLQTYVPLGLGSYLDGVTTHGYYNAGTYAGHPPEQYDTDPNPANVKNALDQQMRELRTEMQSFKPNMRLWSTELGISYDSGAAYSATYPPANELYGQAAVAVRAHLIILGEGAQVTYFFYGSDYPGDIGEGTFFDIVDPQGQYGATTLSPKPEAMAMAALTRCHRWHANVGTSEQPAFDGVRLRLPAIGRGRGDYRAVDAQQC